MAIRTEENQSQANPGTGTTVPTQKLDVNGSINVTGNIFTSGTDYAETFVIPVISSISSLCSSISEKIQLGTATSSLSEKSRTDSNPPAMTDEISLTNQWQAATRWTYKNINIFKS